MLKIVPGNIFASGCDTLVNTVNCVGVMGAGIALEFRLRYPRMFRQYQELCRRGEIRIGRLWLYAPDDGRGPAVLNFPTKKHWKDPSRMDYLEAGLREFASTWEEQDTRSVAFPMLGADRGGLRESEVVAVMARHLYRCDADITIYRYDPSASDDLIAGFSERFTRGPIEDVARDFRIGSRQANAIRAALPRINSLSQLGSVRGVGKTTLASLFARMREPQAPPNRLF